MVNNDKSHQFVDKENLNLAKPSYYNEYNELNTKIKYWEHYLKEYNTIASIPKEYASYCEEKANLSIHNLYIKQNKTAALKDICHEMDINISALIRGVWGIILARYNNVNDIVFGTNFPEVLHNVSKTVEMEEPDDNIVPMPIIIDQKKSLKDIALEVQEYTDAYKAFIQSSFTVSDDNYDKPFDHILVLYNNFHENMEIEKVDSEYDFSIQVSISDCLCFRFNYNANRYTEGLIVRIASHIEKVLEDLIFDKDIQVNKLDIVTKEEKSLILNSFNDTKIEYPRNKIIIDLFEEQVEKNPDSIAIVFNDIKLTYRELNNKSNCVAHYLRDTYQIKPDDLIGVLLNRSEKIIIALLGILKSGAAYLPIDPAYPDKRIDYILSDSVPKVIIAEKTNITSNQIDVIDIDTIIKYDKNEENPDRITNLEHLAYVIYTSGSTGEPKGTLISNASVINFINGITEKIDINTRKTILSLTTYAFDIFVLESFVPLVKGAKVVIADNDELKDPLVINDIIKKHSIDIIQTTPSRMMMLIAEKTLLATLSNLSEIIIGGEVFSRKLFEVLTNSCKGKIYNMYGPTESTVWSTLKVLDKKAKITIGKPIANTKIYVLDSNLNIAPIGVYGEMYISGDGLAKGYLNRPELTQKNFVNNPFVPGEKMYCTGDIGRWLDDGDIEFFGRMDFQVKIRGYRIELEEVENLLIQHESINAAIVNAVTNKNRIAELVAYYVAEKKIEISELRSFLGRTLPDYMIPSYFIAINDLPLNDNGKVNRKLLPDPFKEELYTGIEYVAPTSRTEEILENIWKEVLGHRKISIYDNFFDLGGHSLKAVEIISSITTKLQKEITVKDLFDNPSINSLAKLLNEFNGDELKEQISQPNPVGKKEYYNLSKSQKSLFIISKIYSNTVYNEPIIYKIEGKLDESCVKIAIQSLIKRHESLRTSFIFKDEIPVQIVHDNIDYKIETITTEESECLQLIESLVKPFDLSIAPLMRCVIIRISENIHYLFIDMHHIITDAISQNIFIREFTSFYRGDELSDIKIQYKDFAEWQNTIEQKEKRLKQEKYWLNYLSGKLPILNLPTDFTRPPIQDFKGNVIIFEIDKFLRDQLNEFIQEMSSTRFMVFMSIYAILLHKYTGQNDILIGYPIAGRNHSSLESIIGYFINSLVMRCFIDEEEPYDLLLKRIKNHTLNSYENSEYPFEDLVNALGLPKDLSRSPLFSVSLNMDATNIGDIELNKGCRANIVEYQRNTTKFDLLMRVLEAEDSIMLCLEYSISLFKKSTAEKMIGHFMEILKQIIHYKEIRIKDILLSHRFFTEEIKLTNYDFDF